MQDYNSESLKSNDKNDKILSDYAVTRRQSRSLYRNWAALSKKSVGNSLHSETNALSRISISSIGNDCMEHNKESLTSLTEDRVNEIVRHIERAHSFTEDNPKINSERIENLREMTENLTLKRFVKKKLTKSMVATNRTLGFSKRLKYNLSICLFKIPVAIRHFKSSFELWYSSLKVIEGHFGSNVASYFKFLRKLFLLNACIFILMLLFIMIPQLLFRLFQYVDENQVSDSIYKPNVTINETKSFFNFLDEKANVIPLVMMRSNPYKENDEFRLGNLFTGEGFLTSTILFYGHYTNNSLQLVKSHSYNIPAAYFFTCAMCYLIIFFFLFISVAVSYRKCYIEASRGMHNFFTNKIFCGWDFGIATKQAAELKSKSIYIEIKELLDDLSKPKKRKTCINTFYTTAISFSLNGLLLFLLGLGGMYSWKYLDQQMTKADTATTMMMWLILTLVIAVAPVLFALIAHLEGFESPSSALYMTLIRTFTLYAIVIAVVVAYRLNRSTETECWETILGQDMFRLVVLDFIFGSLGTALSEFIRYRIYLKMWKGIGCPEFDIARSTLNLIYNQTLFYIGLFFSPVLSLLIAVKLFIIFYLKKWGAIYNCKPFVKPWKASQAHTVYLSIAFFAFFCVVIAYGYIITSVRTSNCGPFRDQKFIYEGLLEILSNKNSSILVVFYYITRPGVVGIVLMTMVLGVYYMRAVALARIHVVKHLRCLLRLKAEERKLLLNEISKYTRNQYLPDGSACDYQGLRSPGPNFSNLESSSPQFDSLKSKFFKKGQLKTAKYTFSSMSNLHDENETREGKRNVFNSTQSINFRPSPDSLELRYLPCRKHFYQKEDVEDNLNSKGCSHKGFSEDAQISVLRKESNQESNAFTTVTELNFNPVFTASFAADSGNEIDRASPDFTHKNIFIERLNDKDEDKIRLAEHKKDFTEENDLWKINFKTEERVPSRISYSMNQKTFTAKKHH